MNRNIRQISKSLARDTRGANMVEYIILVGVVALVALGVFSTFGNNVSGRTREQARTVGGINTVAGKE